MSLPADYKSLEHRLEQQLKFGVKDYKKTAAFSAFSLAEISELNLDFGKAYMYYKQATELDPENIQFSNGLEQFKLDHATYSDIEKQEL